LGNTSPNIVGIAYDEKVSKTSTTIPLQINKQGDKGLDSFSISKEGSHIKQQIISWWIQEFVELLL